MNKSIKFEIVTGINKGYFHNNESGNNIQRVSKLWQKIAKEEFDRSGIYVSAIILESKTVYNEDWGCPPGGEDTVVITGVANLEFVDNLSHWKDTVLNLAKKIKSKLEQKTITCEFRDVEMRYIKDNSKQ
ncbi:hypothetical protein SH2C18_48880 [Clostridium sediminicola]|uniref:hypothetical protein n=1 Tax=Clostridium sediminicola TaxID=3114879 RepID=UPI0031F1F26D